ncbi:hypothetical protein PN498_20390 [Oscillatoria sp. CS-180]|uniref:hypothetical protein n=1 Tax=Oscillatoria sp. CS-180 TaxID=3021720 RepID=UPI00232E5997|nr:hypothetical protein [Oscillatoria sp. CS-180]MDB9528362.1 hypothetical protein [Oscillatoria sp. CS-180]
MSSAMRIGRIVVAILIVCTLVSLTVQNLSPVLPLTFLSFNSLALPLGVWISGAIALGVLTTVLIVIVMDTGMMSRHRSSRRRWTVRQDTAPQDSAGNAGKARGTTATSSPREASTRQPFQGARPAREPAPPREPVREASPKTSFQGNRETPPPVNNVAAAEDWQAWEQRPSPNQWEDWSQASSNDPTDENLSRRQRKERQRADATLQDLEKGWDDSAQDTVYVAPGGSQVQDTLDDITEGWDDWDLEDDPPASTAYAQRYEGGEKEVRKDTIYGPPDDAGSDPEASDESVYDADYRVIIPPHRPLNEDENTGDRSP